MVLQGIVQSCASLAQSSLIRARILRQRADIEDELDFLYGPDYIPIGQSDVLREEARHYRLEARNLLVAAEMANGTMFITPRTGTPIPLRALLAGKDFRQWSEYKRQYQDAPLLGGVDPE